jgi:hypothetical protein
MAKGNGFMLYCILNCARPYYPAKKGQIPWGLKIESKAVSTAQGALGAIITKTQLRVFFSNFAPFFLWCI